MALSQQQKELIINVDEKVKAVLSASGDDKTLLIKLFEFMPRIRAIIDSASKKELDMYCYEYDGFYHYMKVLENLAQHIADGRITVPD